MEAGGTEDDFWPSASFDRDAAEAMGRALAARAVSRNSAEFEAACEEIAAMGLDVVDLMGEAYRTSSASVQKHDFKGRELESRRREVRTGLRRPAEGPARGCGGHRGMTSATIAERNRANAKKSTGPRSAQGKAVVSRNARRHGVTSKPDPTSVAAWLRIILDTPDLAPGDLLKDDRRTSSALALAEAEVRSCAARAALDAFERGEAAAL